MIKFVEDFFEDICFGCPFLIDRFPEDFMFEITDFEYNPLIISLRTQFVTSNDRGGRRYIPFAFTEHGVIMLASLLRSDIAVQSSIRITRAFVAMRNEISSIYQAIAALSVKVSQRTQQQESRKKIGFKTGADEKR